jgi:hypothetical protein
MTKTITLSDERLAKLRELAARFKLSREELAHIGMEELRSRPEEGFDRSVEHVLWSRRGLKSDADIAALSACPAFAGRPALM